VDWLDASISFRVVCAVLVFSSGIGVNFEQSSTNGKQGPIHKEIYQTLLTNKKQSNLD
jgi:hypothetical protein